MSTVSAELFPILDAGRVPAKSRPLLDQVNKSFGFVPNLFAVFANSPVLLEGYLALNAAYEKASLDARRMLRARGKCSRARCSG